jgi:hypothetical protein
MKKSLGARRTDRLCACDGCPAVRTIAGEHATRSKTRFLRRLNFRVFQQHRRKPAVRPLSLVSVPDNASQKKDRLAAVSPKVRWSIDQATDRPTWRLLAFRYPAKPSPVKPMISAPRNQLFLLRPISWCPGQSARRTKKFSNFGGRGPRRLLSRTNLKDWIVFISESQFRRT